MKTNFQDRVHNEADLLELQIQIARRADELARRRGAGRDPRDDVKCWVEAERELIAGTPQHTRLWR